MYKSIVKEIGELALSFEEEKIMILFGPQAPEGLKEVAVIHEVEEDGSEQPIKEGGTLQINDQQFTITAVGSLANNNLKELGHISIYFSEPTEEVLPGAVFASPHVLPQFENGSVIEFKA
ncbi:PTS glucitol/sorbitol transporter subunit IIA [Priestia megaterium]|uniref:PTS glucitol/sorbitol transporter subunit IIA n=1 Tax=Priestia megaterium TaxID=1404 RepID=UPI0012D93057|nr:PTS glucitol/sorbitol transporter subunit IIA [Priestia megaterium]MCT9853451.1 PTS glucitol/sorbitol transporter subunit IIA [Priestia megaterium]MDF1962943.1 PTS glucitol/sorbitol transporter subunit IIA [Priestia megaterium]MUL34004.1 PTS system glucitol/sorbitol-specific transporter subunit IIA [Priestia megaterium]